MVRSLKSKNLPLPPVPAPAPDIQNTSSIPSDSNGLVKTTSLALVKPEPVSSSPRGISRYVEKARDGGVTILSSPNVSKQRFVYFLLITVMDGKIRFECRLGFSEGLEP